MLVDGNTYRTIWFDNNDQCVKIIDQTSIPFRLEILSLKNLDDFCFAISEMQVRGAPLIGITAAYGYAIALINNPTEEYESKAYKNLLNTRPTAVNLFWALERIRNETSNISIEKRGAAALKIAEEMASEDVQVCKAIGTNGVEIIADIAREKKAVNILTHCNAGWLATVDWGTALAPIYMAYERDINIHVWVDETRPRNQGASLTAWELGKHSVPHTVITDNTGGHLMQHNLVDLCIVGSDRTTSTGDVCNKIGTYLKALAAYDNNIPFYVALPSSTIDWSIECGLSEIPIEKRSEKEVSTIKGVSEKGDITTVRITPEFSKSENYAFDVTPARLVTGLITEKGIFPASKEGLNILQKKIHE